jgi:hypothetical protein
MQPWVDGNQAERTPVLHRKHVMTTAACNKEGCALQLYWTLQGTMVNIHFNIKIYMHFFQGCNSLLSVAVLRYKKKGKFLCNEDSVLCDVETEF